MAINTKLYSAAINPRLFKPAPKQLAELARVLEEPPRKISSIARHHKGHFAWLKRKIPANKETALKRLNIAGLSIIDERSRYYPLGVAASPLLGSVGLDNQGLFGLEHDLEKELKGEDPYLTVLRDAAGNSVFLEGEALLRPSDGQDIYLTIDPVIQEISYSALQKGLREANAVSGFAVVADPHSGRILAVANAPSYNPHQGSPPSGQDLTAAKMEVTRNHGFLDTFEPGSVLKPLIIAQALEKKKTTPTETHFCHNGVLHIGKDVIHDDHPSTYMTTEEVLILSSNICTYKIADRLGRERVYETLRQFGIANPELFSDLRVKFNGGRLDDPKRWQNIRFANIAFGQGLTVSGLELIQAYSALVNGGRLVKPYLIEKIVKNDGDLEYVHPANPPAVVLSASTSEKIKDILEKVVQEGTGKKASLQGYTAGGKTGTSQKVDAVTKKYSKDKRLASFIGFTPAKDPYLLILVVINEPRQRQYFGGLWAAPVFQDIAQHALEYLNVPKDKINSTDLRALKDHESDLPPKAKF